jgi:glycerol-3-phosphate dehydrogenase
MKKTIKINRNLAKEYGADLLMQHTVIGFETTGDQIEALTISNSDGATESISCSVINAAGPWAGQAGRMADVEIALIAYRGILLVFEELLTKRLLNRCHAPANGDMYAPAGVHTIFGTTAERAVTIEDFTVTKDEVDALLQIGEQLIPGLSANKIINTYAGFRPVYSTAAGSSHGREISRSFAIINHKETNGINNFISIVGGKFMIYERMGDMALNVMQQNMQKAGPSLDLLQMSENKQSWYQTREK